MDSIIVTFQFTRNSDDSIKKPVEESPEDETIVG
jgi:hypothetical protein